MFLGVLITMVNNLSQAKNLSNSNFHYTEFFRYIKCQYKESDR